MKRLPILITLLILTACTAAPTPSPSPASTASNTPPPPVTFTPIPTETAVLTAVPTSTAAPTSEPRLPASYEPEIRLPPGAIARFGRGKFTGVELSPDGQYLGVGSRAGISVYDVETFAELWFNSTSDQVNRIAISPDGTMIAGAVRNETLIWDIQTGEQIHILSGQDGDVLTLSWSPNSSRLFAGSYIGDPYKVEIDEDGEPPFDTMMVWDTNSGELIHSLHSPDEAEMIGDWYDERLPLCESIWSPDGRYLVVGASISADQYSYPGRWLLWWDMNSGQQVGLVPWKARVTKLGQSSVRQRLVMHPEQNTLVAASDDSMLFLDLETGQVDQPLLIPETESELEITFLGISWPDADLPLMTATNEVYDDTPKWFRRADTLRTWDLETGESTAAFARADLGPETIDPLMSDYEWSPTGTEFAAIYDDDTVIIWDAETGDQRLRFHGTGDDLLWLPDGQRLITYSSEVVNLWDVTDGDLLHSVETNEYIHSLAWSPDGSIIAAGTGDGWWSGRRVRWWDIDSGKLVNSIEIEDAGRRGSTGENEYRGPIRTLDFGPLTSRLALGIGEHYGNDGVFIIWDEASPTPVLAKTFEAELNGHPVEEDTVFDVVWWPDETLIAIATSNRVYLLDGQTGDITGEFENLAYVVNRSPDGESIISWSLEDEQVQLIDITTGKIQLSLNTEGLYPTQFKWSPDGKVIAVSTGDDFWEPGRTYLFDAQTGETLSVLRIDIEPEPWFDIPEGHPHTGLVWLDNRIVAITTGTVPHNVFSMWSAMGDEYRGTILIWDVQTGEILLELDGHNRQVQDIALSPDGSTFATASADGTVILWDVAQIMAMINDAR